MQLQMLFDERERHAESPFDTALAALRRGDESKARRLVDERAAPAERDTGAAARRSTVRDCASCSAVLPRPLPYGDPWNEYVLTSLLVSAGEHRQAATYGAESYARQPQPLLAATIARAAGALGDADTAVAWLRAAADTSASTSRPGHRHRPGPRAGRRPRPPRRRRPARQSLQPTG